MITSTSFSKDLQPHKGKGKPRPANKRNKPNKPKKGRGK